MVVVRDHILIEKVSKSKPSPIYHHSKLKPFTELTVSKLTTAEPRHLCFHTFFQPEDIPYSLPKALFFNIYSPTATEVQAKQQSCIM